MARVLHGLKRFSVTSSSTGAWIDTGWSVDLSGITDNQVLIACADICGTQVFTQANAGSVAYYSRAILKKVSGTLTLESNASKQTSEGLSDPGADFGMQWVLTGSTLKIQVKGYAADQGFETDMSWVGVAYVERER